ncbi:MAG: outer membrane beta-barrel protein [Bacteroidetes bacterium]|nr:outer membrane beta-barrel protein [Bacteroidota bacterium]
MKNYLTIVLLLLASFFSFQAKVLAQQRFKAGLVVGVNAAQIKGDDSAGYNKLGLHGGLRAITVLKDKTDLLIELLYSQRGSFDNNVDQFPNGDLSIKLNYVEIPIMLAYKDWYKEEEDYYKVQLTGGLTFSRLINASAEGSKHDAEVGSFNNNDYGITIGADFFISKHFALGARWNHSINLLYNNKNNQLGLDSLVGYFLAFRSMYVF